MVLVLTTTPTLTPQPGYVGVRGRVSLRVSLKEGVGELRQLRLELGVVGGDGGRRSCVVVLQTEHDDLIAARPQVQAGETLVQNRNELLEERRVESEGVYLDTLVLSEAEVARESRRVEGEGVFLVDDRDVAQHATDPFGNLLGASGTRHGISRILDRLATRDTGEDGRHQDGAGPVPVPRIDGTPLELEGPHHAGNVLRRRILRLHGLESVCGGQHYRRQVVGAHHHKLVVQESDSDGPSILDVRAHVLDEALPVRHPEVLLRFSDAHLLTRERGRKVNVTTGDDLSVG